LNPNLPTINIYFMTKVERDTILVPTDFTPVADSAIDHAIEIAKLFNHKICLLHIIGKKTSVSARDKIENQLKRISTGYSNRSGIKISYRIDEGSIFDGISKTADEIEAEFIVMGIHGKQGVQHIVGSYAYKVVCSSKVPVMVVKKKHHHVGYNNIVVPVDFSHESSQKLNQAIKFAKYFDSEVHIIGVIRSKSSVYKIKKEALLKNITDYMENAGVKVVAEVLIKPGADIYEEVIEYADNIDADLIMIVAEKGGRFTGVLGRNDAEQIIDKADMPVLTIVPSTEFDDDDDSSFFHSFIDPLGLIDKP
jgi:nucleotide-binding universal stress UspA family protein